MYLYYLSDLHISDPESEKAKKFEQFLREIPQENDIIVLGGDIFDLFVGTSGFFRKRYKNIISAIENLRGIGCTVFYLEGNHDFHLNKLFTFYPQINVLTDDFPLSVFGKRIWVAHGDIINQKDYGYLFLRWITRTWFLKKIIQWIPGEWIYWIGNWSSRKSRKYSDIGRNNGEYQEKTKNLFREYAKKKIATGYEFVFIGHSHIYDLEKYTEGGHQGTYVNLGYSSEGISYAKYNKDTNSFIVDKFE